MEESYLCLGECHLVVVVGCVCVEFYFCPLGGFLQKLKQQQQQKTNKRELCKRACRILVKTKVTETHHISKTHTPNY